MKLDRPKLKYNMAHALGLLDNLGYRHTPRICNTHCFSTSTMFAGTRVHFAFISTITLLLLTKSLRYEIYVN